VFDVCSAAAIKFSRGGFANFLHGKTLGGDFQAFFLKNPRKLKNFGMKLGTPPGYAPAVR